MDGAQRRAMIMQQLSQSTKPISASQLAKEFQVSRQIIVGDIALLRASGEAILATARGYLLEQAQAGVVFKVAVCHQPYQLADELTTIVSLGGEIVDVIVDHALYGEIRGNLGIKTVAEVTDFIAAYEQSQGKLLSNLTNGIHLHTIRCASIQQATAIKQALSQKGLIYEEAHHANSSE